MNFQDYELDMLENDLRFMKDKCWKNRIKQLIKDIRNLNKEANWLVRQLNKNFHCPKNIYCQEDCEYCWRKAAKEAIKTKRK